MTTNRETVNQHIFALKYDPRTVMVFNGTQIANVDLPTESRFDGSTYLVVTREKCSYDADFDIAVPSAFDDVTYPGALLLASNELLDGKPQELATGKAPINITVNLPGTKDISFATEPTYSKVQAGINETLVKWFDSHGGQWSLPANFQYRSSLIYDENELALKFGCDVTYLKQKLGIDFSRKNMEKKSVYLVQFKQIFYTVSAERPSKPADIFSESTTWEDLSHAGISDVHPPLFVKNVQYGRQIFLKFESTLTSTELESIIKANVTANGVQTDSHGSTEYKSKLSKINVSLVALGGSEEVYKDLNLGGAEDSLKINKIIFENAKLSRSNPAAPLNYYTVYLKDGVTAGVHGKTEYVAEKTESFTGGEIKLEHTGAYVGRFWVSWDEIGYDDKGVKVTRRVNWNGSGADRTASYATNIPLRGNARGINIKTEGCTGLAWEWWRTSGDKVDLALVPERKVSIGGTTLHQSFVMNPGA